MEETWLVSKIRRNEQRKASCYILIYWLVNRTGWHEPQYNSPKKHVFHCTFEISDMPGYTPLIAAAAAGRADTAAVLECMK